MSEVRGIELGDCYEEVSKSEELEKNELSPIDYKTQALLTFFSGLGISDFYAGNYLEGLAKLAASVVIGHFVKGLIPVVIFSSFVELSSGQYTDRDGKVIRQAIQLKKEEISSCDQRIALVLAVVLGVFGAHQLPTLNLWF